MQGIEESRNLKAWAPSVTCSCGRGPLVAQVFLLLEAVMNWLKSGVLVTMTLAACVVVSGIGARA